ncbi:hypothetical protein NQZ68_011016 [Dissostichus eleginoides]|nr:hypothetical protein NQZ68_011016 [Dissostichus eleginoides]
MANDTSGPQGCVTVAHVLREAGHMLAGIDSNNNRSNPTGIDGTRGNLRETPCSIISARSNYRTHAERTADNRQPF